VAMAAAARLSTIRRRASGMGAAAVDSCAKPDWHHLIRRFAGFTATPDTAAANPARTPSTRGLLSHIRLSAQWFGVSAMRSPIQAAEMHLGLLWRRPPHC
jgi:hypothetical protein